MPTTLDPETQADLRSRVVARARRYVEHESPSGDEAALTALAEIVARDAETLGGSVQRHAAPGLGTNLVIGFNGRTTGATETAGALDAPRLHTDSPPGSPLVVLAHIDTVHPVGTLKLQPFRVLADRMEGPGVYDMKTGLVLVLEALALLRERGARPRRPLTLLVTCDEEIGSHSARRHIETAARGAAAVLVPEPSIPGGGVKTQRKGVSTYELRAIGSAAHAGIEPERAVSAIAELVYQLHAVLRLADHPLGTTVNIGTIAGGTATNVVAAEAFAGIDVRSVEATEMQRVHAALESLGPQLPGADLRVTLTEQRPPLERTAAVVALYEHTRRLAAELGIDLAEGASGGGSDGSITAALGAPTLDGLGADGGGAHAVDEHVLLADIPFRVALWARLLETL
jgi:glutamate carboxypeptidase